MNKLIVDCATGEITERELNKAEKDQQKIDEAADQAKLLEEQAEAEAKATKRAELLSKLGITEEEARILLG